MKGQTRIAIVGCRPPTMPASAYSSAGPCTAGRASEFMRQSNVYRRIVSDVAAFVSTLPTSATVISGGASGVDSVARDEASARGLRVIEHRPDYDAHGKRAPLERNTLIVEDADEVHAWPAPWSRGTWDTIRKARAAGKPCVVHRVKP